MLYSTAMTLTGRGMEAALPACICTISTCFWGRLCDVQLAGGLCLQTGGVLPLQLKRAGLLCLVVSPCAVQLQMWYVYIRIPYCMLLLRLHIAGNRIASS